jgi:hypothetical protein
MKRILILSLCLAMIACVPMRQQDEAPLESASVQESVATPKQTAPETTAVPEAGLTQIVITGPASSESVKPTAVITPSATPFSMLDAEKEAALLYRGEHVNLFRGRSDDSWGIIIEQFTWVGHDYIYQPLPGTWGLDDLTVTEILPEADNYHSEALFYIRYLDTNGEERIFCLHHPASDDSDFYPVTDRTGLTLSEPEQRVFEDLMVIGVLYEAYPKTFAEAQSDDWEPLCQRAILDALYTLYDNVLPPYLSGEVKGKYCVLTQTELDSFFRCAIGRPNLVPDRAYPAYRDEMVFVKEDWSSLLPGQVPVADNDWYVWAELRQAVPSEDGSITLYGCIGINDSYWKAARVQVVPADGYLGWRIEQTEACGRTDLQYDPSIVFAPVR